MYAIIETGGKQYKVKEGDTIVVEKLDADVGAEVSFDHVLAVSKEDEFIAGTPTVENAQVTAKVTQHGKGKKIVIFKFKQKKNYRKKQGHRQPFTRVKIEKIQA